MPYAATVNIGASAQRLADRLRADDFLPTKWKGCVEARAYPNDSNDAPPDTEAWTPFLWESTRRKYWSDGDYGASNPNVQDGNGDGLDDDGNPFPLGGDNEWDPDGPESALNLDNDLYQNNGTGPNLGCPPAITPLVDQQVDRARPRSTTWGPGTAAAPWPISASPGAGGCCRHAGAACGAATRRPSCRSTTTRPTWTRSSSC